MQAIFTMMDILLNSHKNFLSWIYPTVTLFLSTVSFKRSPDYNLQSVSMLSFNIVFLAIKKSASNKIKSAWNDPSDKFDCLCYRRDFGIVKLSSELSFITISGRDSLSNINSFIPFDSYLIIWFIWYDIIYIMINNISYICIYHIYVYLWRLMKPTLKSLSWLYSLWRNFWNWQKNVFWMLVNKCYHSIFLKFISKFTQLFNCFRKDYCRS